MNILFITANRLGDAVLSTGILGALIDRWPEARFTVACGPLPSTLFSSIPQVVRVITMVKRPRHGHWRDLWHETWPVTWDMIIDLRNTAISRLLRRRKLLVFRGVRQGQHMVEAFAKLAGFTLAEAGPRVWVDERAKLAVQSQLPVGGNLLALATGAHGVGKRWPAERFAELAVRLVSVGGALEGARVVLLGAPGEEATAEKTRIALPSDLVIDRIGLTKPSEAAAWLARASLYVGNDSGLTHLAAATGVPTLALFGPGIPSRYRPWGKRAAYLIAKDPEDRDIDLCKIDDMLALAEMQKLSVDDVIRRAEGLL